jgi:hypothetical protein
MQFLRKDPFLSSLFQREVAAKQCKKREALLRATIQIKYSNFEFPHGFVQDKSISIWRIDEELILGFTRKYLRCQESTFVYQY